MEALELEIARLHEELDRHLEVRQELNAARTGWVDFTIQALHNLNQVQSNREAEYRELQRLRKVNVEIRLTMEMFREQLLRANITVSDP